MQQCVDPVFQSSSLREMERERSIGDSKDGAFQGRYAFQRTLRFRGWGVSQDGAFLGRSAFQNMGRFSVDWR